MGQFLPHRKPQCANSGQGGSGGHLTGNSSPPGRNKHPSSKAFHQSGCKFSFMGKWPTSAQTPKPFSIQDSAVTWSFRRCLSKPSPCSWWWWSCQSATFCVFLCSWWQEWIATRILEESYVVVGISTSFQSCISLCTDSSAAALSCRNTK